MTFGSPQCQLVQSNNLPTTLLDSCTSSLCHSQSSNTHLGDLQHPHIIGDSTNHHDRLAGIFLRVSDLPVDKANRYRGPIDTGVKETLEDCFVEFRIRATGEESVEFDEEEEVDVF